MIVLLRVSVQCFSTCANGLDHVEVLQLEALVAAVAVVVGLLLMILLHQLPGEQLLPPHQLPGGHPGDDK